jgi:hypothetical protein
MNKTQKANYPAFANLHGGWSKINTGIFYWTVFETEGFVLGYLASANVFTKRIGRILFERKNWIGGKPATDKKNKKARQLSGLSLQIGRVCLIKSGVYISYSQC